MLGLFLIVGGILLVWIYYNDRKTNNHTTNGTDKLVSLMYYLFTGWGCIVIGIFFLVVFLISMFSNSI